MLVAFVPERIENICWQKGKCGVAQSDLVPFQ